MAAARDPRMDRPPEDRPPRLEPVVLFVPSVPDEVRPIDPRRLGSRRSGLIAVLLLAVVAETAALGVTVPRHQAFDGLVAQNLELSERVDELDRKVGDAEAVLSRLELYAARMRSLTQASGDHGGPNLSEDVLQGASLDEADDEGGPILMAGEIPEDGPLDSSLFTPAAAWADAVNERLVDLLDRYQHGEAELHALLADLESLESVGDALPGRWPTDGEITSGFGWRTDPVHHSTRFHAGLDIANSRGTPIYAVAPGTVVRAEMNSGYGRMIDIDHGFGIKTRYAHCTSLRVNVGDVVQRGDFISTMGSTGKSTGPHLHFELRIDDAPHDPIKYLPR